MVYQNPEYMTRFKSTYIVDKLLKSACEMWEGVNETSIPKAQVSILIDLV